MDTFITIVVSFIIITLVASVHTNLGWAMVLGMAYIVYRLVSAAYKMKEAEKDLDEVLSKSGYEKLGKGVYKQKDSSFETVDKKPEQKQ